MRKSLIAMLAAFLVGLSLMGLGPEKVQAADHVFSAGGDGTPENPYKIESAEDLDRVRDKPTASYQLVADINLSTYGNWTPIGTNTSSFQGTFDGAGYTISGMTIHSGAEYVGLFGYVSGPSMMIKNVRLENVDITSTNGTANVGGLVGAITINGTVDNSSVSGQIEGVTSAAGGLVGQIASGSKLIRGSSNANVNLNIGKSVGGLVGGVTSGTIEQSYATGTVSLSGSGKVGGLAGDASGSTILDSYATGGVTANGISNIGGLLGSAFHGTIKNSYATAILINSGTGFAGGLIGFDALSNVQMSGSYWNSDVNPDLLQTIGGNAGMVEGVNENVMKDLVAYAGWDSTIWGIQAGTGYPYLKAFSPVLRVDPVSSVYSTKSGSNMLSISGSIRDGSIGEPVQVGYVITRETTPTVTVIEAVYDAYKTDATGEDQPFHFSVMLNEADYPDGDYALTIVGADTVGANEQAKTFNFVVDSTPPVISLTGSEPMVLEVGSTFTDPGATAFDARDGDVTGGIITSGIVNTAQAGTYTRTYQVTDAMGNTATKTRTVKVYNSLYPKLLLNGFNTIEVEVGDMFTDPGATASDERDGDITGEIEITGSADTGRVGIYSINYLVENSLGNQSSATRTVKVVDCTAPVLTLLGANPMQLEAGRNFVDPGATAMDAVDGDLTAEITVTGAVYTNQVGTYTLTYQVQDHSGNAALAAVRTVKVVRTSSSSGGGSPGGSSSEGQTGGNPSEGKPGDGNTGNTTPPEIACSFTDLERHWAKADVCEAAKLGIVEGMSSRIFMPNAPVTRTEFAVMLLRTLRIEIDNEAGALAFSDRDSTPKWALPAIRTAVAKGVLTGYPDGTLKPVQTVSRSELAAMVSRAMKWQADSKGNGYFSDEASIPTWARGYVEAAREHGVLTGRAGNRFAPVEVTTRAEAAVVLLRLWKVLY